MKRLIVITILLIILITGLLLFLTSSNNETLYENMNVTVIFSSHQHEEYLDLIEPDISYKELLNMSRKNPFSLIFIAFRVFPSIRDLLVVLVIVTSLVFFVAVVCIVHEVFSYMRRGILYEYEFSYYRRRRYRQ